MYQATFPNVFPVAPTPARLSFQDPSNKSQFNSLSTACPFPENIPYKPAVPGNRKEQNIEWDAAKCILFGNLEIDLILPVDPFWGSANKGRWTVSCVSKHSQAVCETDPCHPHRATPCPHGTTQDVLFIGVKTIASAVNTPCSPSRKTAVGC